MTFVDYTLNFNSHLRHGIDYFIDFHYQWTAIACLCVFLFSLKWILPRFGLAASLLFADLAYSSIWVWLYKDNRYLTVDAYNQMALRYFSCDSIAKIMLIGVPIMMLSDNRMGMLFIGEATTAVFVVLSCLVAFWEAATVGCNGLTCGGLVGNPSISMGLMGCMLPIAIHSWRRQWAVIIMAAAAVFISKSSIGLGIFAVYCALSIFPWGSFRNGIGFKRLVASIFCVPVILGAGYWKLGPELINDSDRFKIWRFMMHMWNVPWNWINGTGSGTYHVFSINLQNGPGHPAMAPGFWWNTFHCDPLQMLFECGIVGLILFVAAYFSALVKVIKEERWPVAMSIVLFGCYMCLDPALHNPIPILFGAWLFVYALRKPKECL